MNVESRSTTRLGAAVAPRALTRDRRRHAARAALVAATALVSTLAGARPAAARSPAPPAPSASSAPFAERETRWLLVLPLSHEGVAGTSLALDLDARLVAAAERLSAWRVLRPAELDALRSMGLELGTVACPELERCAAELARRGGTDLVLGGRLTALDAHRGLLALSITDVRQSVVLARALTPAVDAAGLPAALDAALTQLFAQAGDTPSAARALDPARLEGRRTTLVLGLHAFGAPDGVAHALTDALAAELAQLAALNVKTLRDVEDMLGAEALRRVLECDSLSCALEISGATGADWLVSGSVSRVGESWVVTVRLIEIAAGDIPASATERFVGPPDELLVGMRFVARRLVGLPLDGSGRLRIDGPPAGTGVDVDHEAYGELPLPEPIVLPAGRHQVALSLDDHAPFLRDVYVEPGRVSHLSATLRPLPVPLWRRWWFWPLAVVTVAAGVAVGRAITEAQTPPETGSVVIPPGRTSPSPSSGAPP